MVPRRREFLAGVFLIAFAVLFFQIVQTRILSVIAWYYLAFFAISVAMLGMTAGAVWVYLRRESIAEAELSTRLSDTALLTAVSMPVSVLFQFSLITTPLPTVTSALALSLLMAVMTVPYVFAGITLSLALTRSPYPVSLVYGVDLLGAALGCMAVVATLEILDGPSAILAAGLIAALASFAFARGATPPERARLSVRRRSLKPASTVIVLAAAIPLNLSVPIGFKPIMVKDQFESRWRTRTERWNSYSRILAYRPVEEAPTLWSPSPAMPPGRRVQQAYLNIDGAAGTTMHHFDGTRASIDFLAYDLVNLAYHLPGIRKSAVIGVGGGRDLLSAHLFGVQEITGVELNSIFADLLLRHPVYASFANVRSIPGLTIEVDDGRSWFAATDQTFDLIQMSLIDTWAATGAGAFSLSENGLYTLEGWRAFTRRLSSHGVFTVSRWYNPGDVNESGRMIALAVATVIDAGRADPRRHIFVSRGGEIATLVLAASPFTPEQLAVLRRTTSRLGFEVLVDPDTEPTSSALLQAIVRARDRRELDAAVAPAALDLSVPTDNRPFFFNQLRFRRIPELFPVIARNEVGMGVLRGNLVASIILVSIMVLAAIAVVATILLPLRHAARRAPPRLIAAGTGYFALIGLGFMFAEISLLQYFGVFLGHPIYAMGVCLFSLILSTGIGSLVSERVPLKTRGRIVIWGAIAGGYLIAVQALLPDVFAVITARQLPVRIATALAVLMPAGFLMGFGFPTGMALVERIDRAPTPWFWGINGATGVLASVIAVMIGMAYGINVTMILAGLCYLALIPAALGLSGLAPASNRA